MKEAIQSHLKETEGHVKKLEQVFQSFDEKAKGKTCEATVGLLEEGDEIAADFKGSPAINAALISAAQKVEHYEMASYGCLHEWAGLLGNKEGRRPLARNSRRGERPPMKRSPSWRVPAATKKLWANPTKRDRRKSEHRPCATALCGKSPRAVASALPGLCPGHGRGRKLIGGGRPPLPNPPAEFDNVPPATISPNQKAAPRHAHALSLYPNVGGQRE